LRQPVPSAVPYVLTAPRNPLSSLFNPQSVPSFACPTDLSGAQIPAIIGSETGLESTDASSEQPLRGNPGRFVRGSARGEQGAF